MPIMMYDYAACLLAAFIGGTLFFTVTAMCVMLWSAGGVTWRWWRDLATVPKWLTRRWATEPRMR